MTTDPRRQALVEEAKTWLNTPWHHEGKIKGAGVDCGQILIEIYVNCGLIERPIVESYPADWSLHRGEERYLQVVERYCHLVDAPLPGDLVVYRQGKTFSHGGLVVEWPLIIHAHVVAGVVYADGNNGELIKNGRQRRFYSYFKG